MTTENWIAIAQLIVGAAVAIMVPVVGWVVWTLGNHRDRLTAIETLTKAESEDNFRRFSSIERWMEKADAKLERLLGRKQNDHEN